MTTNLKSTGSVVAVFVLLFAVWIAGAYWSHPGYQTHPDGTLSLDDDGLPKLAGPILFPSPAAVLQDLYRLLVRQSFLKDIGISLMRIGAGLLSSVVPAFILGIWLGINAFSRSAITPLFAFIQYIPPVAFVPVLILWFGIGLPQQVALLFIGTFFYLTLMIADTVANIPSAYRDAALTLGAKPHLLIWRVILPFGLPEFIQHLRVIVGIAWTYLTVVEMVSAETGIGSVIINSQRYLQTGRAMAGLFTIGVLGVLCDLALRGTSRLLCRWKY
jgi:NitT/TauT family transport system permease protein